MGHKIRPPKDLNANVLKISYSVSVVGDMEAAGETEFGCGDEGVPGEPGGEGCHQTTASEEWVTLANMRVYDVSQKPSEFQRP
jgi:hypothetical protein